MTLPQDRITPRTLKGFRDFLPAAMMPREALMETARRVYRSYGYSPIDTPALEYLEILTGKGSEETDKQLYRFTDHGGREVGLRFDLTVPLARFAAQHIGDLGTPFKRYHIGTVWRGENTQRGRYREFAQCDFDTIGTTSIAADIETVLVVHDLFRAIGFARFTIHVNNRRVLSGLLEKLDLAERCGDVLRALDKLDKIGREKVSAEMESSGVTREQADTVLSLGEISGSNERVVDGVARLVAGSDVGEVGARELRDVLAGIAAAGVSEQRVRIAPATARGLDYYTGTVLETTLDDLPGIGSVASGGRYDNLAGLFTAQQLPGIGASLGLDRLLAAMEELGLVQPVHTPADVLVVYFQEDRLGEYLKLASIVRAAGVAVEVFPEPKKLGKQLQYADRRGHRVALIAGADELAAGQCQVKDLASGRSETVALVGAVAQVLAVLGMEGKGETGKRGASNRAS
jgi:histidyl-tRNA synthetase